MVASDLVDGLAMGYSQPHEFRPPGEPDAPNRSRRRIAGEKPLAELDRDGALHSQEKGPAKSPRSDPQQCDSLHATPLRFSPASGPSISGLKTNVSEIEAVAAVDV